MSAIRPTTYQVQVKIFEAAGCRYIRTHGDHLIYAYPGAIRPVVIPKYQEVPAFIIKKQYEGHWDDKRSILSVFGGYLSFPLPCAAFRTLVWHHPPSTIIATSHEP